MEIHNGREVDDTMGRSFGITLYNLWRIKVMPSMAGQGTRAIPPEGIGRASISQSSKWVWMGKFTVLTRENGGLFWYDKHKQSKLTVALRGSLDCLKFAGSSVAMLLLETPHEVDCFACCDSGKILDSVWG